MNLDAYLTRAQAAMVTGVAPSVISHWRARGWLDADGQQMYLRTRPGRGQHLTYRLGDILTAERDTRSNPNSRRPANRALLAA